MLVFGYLSDKIGRKFGMVRQNLIRHIRQKFSRYMDSLMKMAATGIVALFSGLSAASYGANDSFSGLIASLSAYRFLLGIGVSKEFCCLMSFIVTSWFLCFG